MTTCKRTITTEPTGYVGKGNSTEVFNGQVYNYKFKDILRNDAGDRVRAEYHVVFNIPAGTARVDEFKLVCLGQ